MRLHAKFEPPQSRKYPQYGYRYHHSQARALYTANKSAPPATAAIRPLPSNPVAAAPAEDDDDDDELLSVTADALDEVPVVAAAVPESKVTLLDPEVDDGEPAVEALVALRAAPGQRSIKRIPFALRSSGKPT